MCRGRIEGGEFGGVGFAQDNRPSRLEPGHCGGIVVRDVIGENPRPAGGAQTGGKKKILYTHPYPMQRATYLPPLRPRTTTPGKVLRPPSGPPDPRPPPPVP